MNPPKTFNQAMLDWLLEHERDYLDDDDPPVAVTGVEYEEGGWTGCDTCGDDPDTLTVTWRTASGRRVSDTYYDLELASLIDQLLKGNEQ